MNSLYHELISLYNALNDRFLNDLKHYSIENYSIDLYEAIKRYAAIEPDENLIIEDIQELKKDNSISCMSAYYELIDLMIENIGG